MPKKTRDSIETCGAPRCNSLVYRSEGVSGRLIPGSHRGWWCRRCAKIWGYMTHEERLEMRRGAAARAIDGGDADLDRFIARKEAKTLIQRLPGL